MPPTLIVPPVETFEVTGLIDDDFVLILSTFDSFQFRIIPDFILNLVFKNQIEFLKG